MKKRTRNRPFSLNGALRDIEHLCRFGDRQTGKVSKLDNPRLTCVKRAELRERLIHVQHIIARIDGRVHVVLQLDQASTAPLIRAMRTCVVDKDATHKRGGNGVKVPTTIERGLALIDQPEVSLMHERRGLKRMSVTFVP